MAENTATEETQNTASKATEAPSEALTPDALAEEFSKLPPMFQDAIRSLNERIEKHNANVTVVKSAESKDTKALKAEIREQNPSGNKKIAAINDRITKLNEQIEKLVAEANSLIDSEGLMPKDRSEEEINALREEVKESSKTLRSNINATTEMAKMMFGDTVNIENHVSDIQTMRGVSKAGTGNKPGGGTGIKRPRFSKITVNGLTEKDGVKVAGINPSGQEKYTFSFLAQFLSKQARDINWTAGNIQDAYFASLPEGKGPDNMPDSHTFDMVHNYKDNSGNEHAVTFTITATK